MKITKTCPKCKYLILFHIKSIFRAIYIDCTRCGPRVHCPHCHASLNCSGYNYTGLQILGLLCFIVLLMSKAIIGYILFILLIICGFFMINLFHFLNCKLIEQ